MEKKKLLLVAVSVGVFLVIVIGAAILVFSPRNAVSAISTAAASPTPAGSPINSGAAGNVPADTALGVPSQPASVDPADMVRNPDGIRGLQPSPILPGTGVEDNFFVNGENERQSIATAEDAGPEGANTIITVTRPTTAAVPNTPVTGRSASSTTAPRPAVSSAPAARTSSAASSRSTTPTASTSTTSTAAAQSSSTTAKASTQNTASLNNYWVQTGSFSTQTKAEGAKELLVSKGITPIIENRNVNGKMFFRVRVGPYTSRNEADYWLALIKSISGFEDSQIWMNQSRP